ncbi:Tyrosine recombinase XerC [bacterium HR09]|nr:Tyrosine recombinase XerC [bacterium HR09]
MRVKITDRLLERKDLPRFVFDTELTGFGVEVLRSGKRAFFVQYGPRNRRRRFSFGVWPVFNAGAARQKAKELLLAVAQGKDPVRERQEERQSQELTFADWVRHYLVEVTQRKKQPRHDRCYLPRAAKILGTLPLVALTPGDIARALQTILKEAAKHPAASGPVPGATTANRFLASVRACLAVAKRRGLIPTNPAEAVEPLPEPPPRARVLTDSELARLGEVLATWPNPIERAAITLLMETGARSSELLRARWEDVDLEAEPPYWRIPSPKAGTPQVVPLTPGPARCCGNFPGWGSTSSRACGQTDPAQVCFPHGAKSAPLPALPAPPSTTSAGPSVCMSPPVLASLLLPSCCATVIPGSRPGFMRRWGWPTWLPPWPRPAPLGTY